MDTFAVVEIHNFQFKVTPNEDLLVPKIEGEPGKKIILDKLLLISREGKISVGTPYISGEKLESVIVAQEKGLKIKISKYKAKSRYQKETGFRAKLTRIKIEDFGRATKKTIIQENKTQKTNPQPKKHTPKK